MRGYHPEDSFRDSEARKRIKVIAEAAQRSATTGKALVVSPVRTVVRNALAKIRKGSELDRYFGISSGKPKQPDEEACSTAVLLREIENPSRRGLDLIALRELMVLASTCGANPDSLRALTRSPTVAKKPRK